MIRSRPAAGWRLQIAFIAAAMSVALMPSVAAADTSSWTEITRLVSPEPEGTFGGQVAVAGTTVAVSEGAVVYVFQGGRDPIRLSPSGDVGVIASGSPLAMTDALIALGTTDGVYVFERGRNGWRETTRLAPSGGGDTLILSVAVDGSTIVAGVDSAAYVFTKTRRGWQQRATLTSGVEGDGFGRDVAISGDVVAVTASNAGAAYVFRADRRGRWLEEARLQAADGETIGYSVAVDDGTVMVGAPGVDTSGFFAVGAVYVFVLEGGSWIERAQLTVSDPVEYAVFGWDIAISDGVAVIGAPGGLYEGPGAAYVFRDHDGDWVEEAKLVASAPAAEFVDYSFFGANVAIDGKVIAAGAPFDVGTGGEFLTGAAYVFRSD